MSDDSTVGDMYLPLVNPNEALETISENSLRPLFDVNKFQFCSQDRRDKGIDLTYEIINSGRHTSFRLVIQLKSTQNLSKNSDDSFSLQIETSNLNYLLNSSYPSYYVLYINSSQKFYCKSTNEILLALASKQSDWQTQKSHAIHFTDMLIPSVIEKMYEAAMAMGKMQRKLREKALLISASMQPTDNIIVSSKLKVTDDQTIRQEIEQNGFHLINQGKWKQILDAQRNTTSSLQGSRLYHLILGIAHYYTGELGLALHRFQQAKSKTTELSKPLQAHLQYFELLVKYSLGMVEEQSYQTQLQTLSTNEFISHATKIATLKNNYLNLLDTAPNGHRDFIHDLNLIINDTNTNENLKFIAQCELLYYDGYDQNIQYLNDVILFKGREEKMGVNFQGRGFISDKYQSINNKRTDQFENIINSALRKKNNFIYFTATVNHVRVMYQFEVFYRALHPHMRSSPTPNDGIIDKYSFCQPLIAQIHHAKNYFIDIGHLENRLTSSAVLYELLHYVGDNQSAEYLISEIMDLANNYDLGEYQIKLNSLKDGGTTHEIFKSQIMDNVKTSI